MARQPESPILDLAQQFREARDACTRNVRADYNAMQPSRFRRLRTGLLPMGTGADWHYRVETLFLKLIEYARDADRNDAIIGQAITRSMANTIHGGFRLAPRTPDDKLNKDLADRWQVWSEDPEQCDVTGEMTFADMQEYVYRSVLVDGDCFAYPTEDGQIQIVEAHRCRTPYNTTMNVACGILLAPNRRRLQYWFTKDDINPLVQMNLVSSVVKYPAYDADGEKQVFHIYDPKRVTQTRGVTALAPIFDLSGMFDDIQFARVVQQQVISCIAIFRQREAGWAPAGPAGSSSIGPTPNALPLDQQTVGLAPGAVITGQPGETLTAFSPNVPGTSFFEQTDLVLNLIGVNLGLPLSLVLMNSKGASWSGGRLELEQAHMGFRRNQRWFGTRFNTPIYRWKLRQWIAEDSALRSASQRFKTKFFDHQFNPPRWPYLQPQQDATANQIRKKDLQISPSGLMHELGREWDDVTTEIVNDNTQMIRKALVARAALDKELPGQDILKIDWHEFTHIGTPTISERIMENPADAGNDAGNAAPETTPGTVPPKPQAQPPAPPRRNPVTIPAPKKGGNRAA